MSPSHHDPLNAPVIDATSSREPLSIRLCEYVCFIFALWTLCSFTAVSLGLTLRTLIWLFAACLSLAWFLRSFLRKKFRADEPLETPQGPKDSPGDPSRGRSAIWAAVAAFVVLAVAWLRPSVETMWWSAVVLLAAAFFLVVRDQPQLAAPVHGRRHERALWGLALVCVVVALASHRPDADDAQYIDIAASAADLPQWSLLSGDTLHGIPGLPLIQPIYRCHSYELWNGALSYLTSIPAIYCFHWISASLTALLLPLAWARLFRVLTPKTWLWAVFIFVFVLLAAGETHRWYGNFALVRIWQGKALFLFVFMPLVYTYALRFGIRPNLRDWILLSAAQIAAMGSSSSALWCAPFGAAVAFAGVWRPDRKNLPAVVMCALASSVLVVAGISLKTELTPYATNVTRSVEEPDSLLEPALHTVLGDGTLLPFCMLTVLFAWLLTRHAVARRFLVVIPLSFLLFLFNPYTAKLVMVHMTGPAFWRSLWAVPMPLFITMILVAPVAMWSSKRRRRLPRLAVAVALFAFAWWVPRFSALSEENGVALHRPGLKVPPIEYDLALQLQAAVPPRAYVVAPNDVNPWIATQNHHPYQLNVRNLLSSSRMRAFLGGAEIERRRTMNSVVSGFLNQKGSLDVFRRGLDAYRIEGVCLKRMPKTPKIRRVLNDLGFHRIYVHGDYELWTRRLEPT